MKHKLANASLVGATAVLVSALLTPAHAEAATSGTLFRNLGKGTCVTPYKAAAGNWATGMSPCKSGSAAKDQVHDVTQPEGTYYTIQSHDHGVCIGAHSDDGNIYSVIYISCTDKNARFMRFPAPGGHRYAFSDGGMKGEYLYATAYVADADKSGEGTDRIWAQPKP